MTTLTVDAFVSQIKEYSNMTMDLSILVEPFGLFVQPYDFEGVLLGIFIEDLLDQYAPKEKIDVYNILDLIGFYANSNEAKTIAHSQLASTKHGACHSL